MDTVGLFFSVNYCYKSRQSLTLVIRKGYCDKGWWKVVRNFIKYQEKNFVKLKGWLV